MTLSENKRISEIRRRAFRGGAAMVLGKFINQAIGFGVVWTQAHYLNVDAYGVFGLFLGTAMYIATLGNMGTSDIVRRFIPEFAEKDEKDNIAVTVRALLLIRFAGSAVVLGLVVLLYNWIGPILNILEYKTAFTFYAIGILFFMEARLMYFIYWALLEQVRYTVALTGYNIFRLVTFFIVLRASGGLVEALAVDAASQLILFLGLYIPFTFEFDIKKGLANSSIPVKRLARYGLFMYFGNLGHIFFNTTTDMYVISAYLNQVQLGYYAFAVNIGNAIMKWMPSKLVGSIVESVVYRDYTRKGSDENLSKQFMKIISAEAFFVIPTMVLLITFSEPIIRWVFDIKYLPAKGILAALGVVFAVTALRFPLDLIATTKEKVRLLFISQIIFAIYNLIADLLLVPLFGLWGAVIATGSSVLFIIVTLWVALSRYIRLTIETPTLLRIAINASGMGLFFYLIKGTVGSLAHFILAFLAGGCIYLILSWFNRPFDKETIAHVLAFIKNEENAD